MAEDEFFKGIAYRASVRKQALQQGASMYDAIIRRGGSVDEARVAQAEAEAQVIANPPKPIKMKATDAAKELTFQGDLGKFTGGMEGFMSHPLTKIFGVPFFKTPVNIPGGRLGIGACGYWYWYYVPVCLHGYGT
jgi:hypothetical protein